VVSGQIAQDERGELVGPGDPAEQARQVFENLRRRLAAAGADFGDVVKLAVRPPASTAVQVAALFAPGYLLEVEAWALVGD
jgi:enamine deaminase RidA (YjgF/YER057c/UK114 family)